MRISHLFRTLVLLAPAFLASAQTAAVRFSRAPITDPKTAKFETRFKPGDPIYGLATFDAPLSEVKDTYHDEVYLIVAFGTEEDTKYVTFDLKPSQMKERSLAFALIPETIDPKDDRPQTVLAKLREVAGGGLATIHVFAGTAQNAKGAFTLDLSGGLGGYQRVLDAYESGKELPQAKQHDAALERQILALFKGDSDATDYRFYKVVLTQDEWQVNRDQSTGVIRNRTLSVAVLCRKLSTNQCMARRVVFHQSPMGGGQWSRLSLERMAELKAESYPCDRFNDLK